MFVSGLYGYVIVYNMWTVVDMGMYTNLLYQCTPTKTMHVYGIIKGINFIRRLTPIQVTDRGQVVSMNDIV